MHKNHFNLHLIFLGQNNSEEELDQTDKIHNELPIRSKLRLKCDLDKRSTG